MKKFTKSLLSGIAIVMALAIACPSAFAREFAPVIDANNIGVHTQYKYEENDPSWIRQLVIKEDMLSSNGLFSEEVLIPACAYPYTTDAPNFKATVEENIKLYTLDDDSQRAAYLYLFEQFGALSVIANPEISDKSKADWLREQGIVITEEDEKDPDKKLMISALYALMKDDFYYVIKGERITIPKGTPLEEATVMCLMGLSNDNAQLTDFVLKFFGKTTVVDLEDYIYYTSLMALYTQGYVSPVEIPEISRDEVFRRVAIMTIRSAGIAIDSETATTEEIRQKYLAAMIGKQYSVTVDPVAFIKALEGNTVPYYILQRMAYEDAKLTISSTKYNYEECFKLVLLKTQRFNLENEFYSDIFEYNVHLDNIRSTIYVNPNPINKSGVTISINGATVTNGSYAAVTLTQKESETITIVSQHGSGKKMKTSVYKVTVHQGNTPAPDSDLTGLIPTLGGLIDSTYAPSQITLPSVTTQTPAITDPIISTEDVTSPLLDGMLSLNEKGQLVDRYGNIVNDYSYETFTAGHNNTDNADSIISIVPGGVETTELTTTEPTTKDSYDTPAQADETKITIIVPIVFIILLLIAIIIVAVISKKKSNMTDSEKMRARKAREKRKKNRKK